MARAILSLPDDASRTFAAHVASLGAALAAAQRGAGAPVEVLEGQAPGEFVVTKAADAPAGTAAVVRTSGSTGMPKRTALPAAALAASAAATREHLGGDGHWLLALPLHYVAGLAVLSRALLGNTRLVTLDLREHFNAHTFAAATALLQTAANEDAELGGEARPLYTSLVPTQLTRLLASQEGTDALRAYGTVLVGGGRTPDATLAAAREAGIAVVLTYGSAETCGGCVYNGVPLPGVRAEAVDGRLRLGGPMAAGPYLGDPLRSAEHFFAAEGTRWYVTDDLGAVTDGVVSVAGRIDDVINTGGVKVSAQQVQRVAESVPGIAEALVVGANDPEWGQRVCLAYSLLPGHDDAAFRSALSEEVRGTLGSPAVPRVWLPYPALPRLGNGKPDRQRVIAAAQEHQAG